MTIQTTGDPFLTVSSVNLQRFMVIRTELQNFLRTFGIKRFKAVGTTNKAPIMGDIDLAVEGDVTRDELYDRLSALLGSNFVKRSGSAMVSFVYVCRGVSKMPPLNYQVDLFVGNIRFVDWARAAPSSRMGRGYIKGVFRNMMLNAILRVQSKQMFSTTELDRTRLVLDFDTGLYLVKQTKKGKTCQLKNWLTIEKTLVSNDPDEIVMIIFGNDKLARYVRSFEELIPRMKNSPRTKDIVDETYKEFMNDVLEIEHDSKVFSGHRDDVLEIIEDAMYALG